MRAEHLDIAMPDGELADTRLVVLAGGAIAVDPALEVAQDERAPWLGFDLAVKEVAVTGVEPPAALAAHGNAAVSGCVAMQRHEQHVGLAVVELSHTLEAAPALPASGVAAYAVVAR